MSISHSSPFPMERHGTSPTSLPRRGSKVVDLGSDYRLDTNDRYAAAYGSDHPLPDELGAWRYGLPELFDLTGADRVASPGCYPTAVLLAIVPLIRAGLVQPGTIVADCLSGVSGAGRSLKEDLLFGAVAEGVRAYGVTTHRHRPEIEMAIEQATDSTFPGRVHPPPGSDAAGGVGDGHRPGRRRRRSARPPRGTALRILRCDLRRRDRRTSPDPVGRGIQPGARHSLPRRSRPGCSSPRVRSTTW